MIYPSIDEITKGRYNRYSLVIATARCARAITEKEIADTELAKANAERGTSLPAKKDSSEPKAVKKAIYKLYRDEVVIIND